jgi:hypothetical protein
VLPGLFGPLAFADLNGDGVLDIAAGTLGAAYELHAFLGNGHGAFVESAVVPLANSPGGVFCADLNHDGKQDVFVSGTLTILLGNGDGTFQLPSTLDAGGGDVAIADFDGDGALDVATTDTQNGVWVFPGRGDGTLRGPTLYPTGLYVLAATAADLNGDGKPDLAVANGNSANVSILLNAGDGGFAPAVNASVAPAYPTSIVARDFDGDGRLDVAVTDQSNNQVDVLLGNGDGTLQPAQPYNVGVTYPGNILAGDFVGDGHTDLVCFGQFSSGVSALAGGPGGTFQPYSILFSAGTSWARAADLNGDGRLDLAYADYNGTPVGVALNPFSGISHQALPAAPYRLQQGDFNNDFNTDIVTANNATGSVGLLIGLGDVNFAPELTFDAGAQPTALVPLDIDGDGRLDLAVANHAGTVTVLRGGGDAGLTAAGVYAAGGSPVAIDSADLNGDGRADLVVANAQTQTLTVLLNDGGTFVAAPAPSLTSVPAFVRATDVDGDGRVDLIVTAVQVTNPIMIPATVTLLRGLGDGTFAAPVPITVTGASEGLAVADFNGDGLMDLAVSARGLPAGWLNGTVSVLLGTDAGTFLPERVSVATGGESLTTNDMNGDGRVDLVLSSSAEGTLEILPGRGDGTFGTPLTFATGATGSCVSLILADFNHDAQADFVTCGYPGPGISVLMNQGCLH